MPVREAAPGALHWLPLLRGEPRPQLPHQPRLADAGVAHDRHQAWLLVAHDPFVGGAKLVKLVVASHERLTQATDTAGTYQRKGADEPPRDDAVRLALRLDRDRLLQLERAPHGGGGSLAHEDLAACRRLLEPCGDVHCIARDEGAALARPADDHLARVHTDPDGEPIAEELVEPTLHRQRGVQRPFGVILERRRRPERSHHRIADELLHCPTRPLDLPRHRVVETVDTRVRSGSCEPASSVEPSRWLPRPMRGSDKSARRRGARRRTVAGGHVGIVALIAATLNSARGGQLDVAAAEPGLARHPRLHSAAWP